MFTKDYVLAMVLECKEEEKKTQHVPHYYKRNGQMLRRSYDDDIETNRYRELFYDLDEKFLRSDEAKIFCCQECDRMVGYWDLESWCCNFDTDTYLCAECYELGMGDDL